MCNLLREHPRKNDTNQGEACRQVGTRPHADLSERHPLNEFFLKVHLDSFLLGLKVTRLQHMCQVLFHHP